MRSNPADLDLRNEVIEAIARWSPENGHELASILREKRGLRFTEENFARVLNELQREGMLDLEATKSGPASSGLARWFPPYTDLLLIVICIPLLLLALIPQATLLTPLRWITGILMVVLFPGYVIQASIFPRMLDLNVWKRVVLSFGLSIAVTAFYVAILDATQYGVTVGTVVPLLTLHVLVFSVVSFLRRPFRRRSG